MENRNGLLADLKVSQATGSSEREMAERMLKRQRQKGVKVKSWGADKGYDTPDFVKFLPRRKILPHVAASVSQRMKESRRDSWRMKTVGGFRKARSKGTERTQLAARSVGAAYNLVRMAKLALYAV